MKSKLLILYGFTEGRKRERGEKLVRFISRAEPIQWPLGKRKREREKRERERERESIEREENVLLIKMSRFVFITIAIIRARFVSIIHCYNKTLCK